jgi:SAM-dependent methyltransferase
MLRTGHELTDDEIRRRYDALDHRGGLGAAFVERVLGLADDLRIARALDVGCGNGELLRALSARVPQAALYGIDSSASRVRATRARLDDRATVIAASAEERLPFADAVFDVVFCTEVIEHVKAPVRCLAEIRRVLKPDGRLVLTVPNATGFAPFHRLDRLVPGAWLRSKLLPYEHPANTDQPIDTCLRYDEIRTLVEAGAFTIERVSGYRYFRYLEMLPIVRAAYRPVAPAVERLLPRVGGQRFAYNLLLRCAPRHERGVP